MLWPRWWHTRWWPRKSVAGLGPPAPLPPRRHPSPHPYSDSGLQHHLLCNLCHHHFINILCLNIFTVIFVGFKLVSSIEKGIFRIFDNITVLFVFDIFAHFHSKIFVCFLYLFLAKYFYTFPQQAFCFVSVFVFGQSIFFVFVFSIFPQQAFCLFVTVCNFFECLNLRPP